MKRLVAFLSCVLSAVLLPPVISAQNSLSCQGIELTQTDLVITCDNEVLLQSLTGPLLWNQNLFSDSILVSTSGIVEAQEAALDLSFVDLGEEFGYLDLGDGFDNLSFPVTIAARFSIPEGHENFHLFATDEGLGYSGIWLTYTTQGWLGTGIGDGDGSGPSYRRSKKSYCSLSTDTWYTVVAIIRGATDHSVYLDGLELEGDYSGSGNGQIVDLGRPATMGYHVPDSGPLVGQEWSSTMKFDFLGVYDFEVDPMDIVHAGPCDTDNASALVQPSGAVGWYDFNEVETYADSEGNQAPIQVVGEVHAEVSYCLCPEIELVEIQLLDCEYADFFCGDGTTWDADSQTCVVANPADTNFDGCVSLIDLLGLLSAFGNCAAEDSTWACGDPLEYQGYDYSTVLIGEQCWFTENLRAEAYSNGDVIPTAPENVNWINGTFGGMVTVYSDAEGECGHYSPTINACDVSQSLPEYGRLYNKDAVQDDRGLCPTGWHVAVQEELMALREAFGATELKAVDGWYEDENGNNASGFDANPNGYRNGNTGQIWNAGYQANWWAGDSGYATMNNTSSMLTVVPGYGNITGRFGFGIRCVKDGE